MPTLETKISSFNSRYQVNLTSRQIVKVAETKLGSDSFTGFNENDEKVVQTSAYIKALTDALNDSLHANTKIQANGVYSLFDFDLVKFAREFEELVQTGNAESASPRKREPFEGMSLDDVMKRIKNSTKAYDKPLYSIWANKIVDGKISYEDLKSVTDGAIERIEYQEKSPNGSVQRNDLANVVYAHEAMFRVRQSRGFWWKVFHLYQNYKEEKYLEALSYRISEYLGKNYPIDEISNSVSDSMMQGAYDNMEYTLRREDDQRVNENVQRQLQEEEARNREISSVSQQLQPVIDDPAFKGKLTDSIVKNLPKCGVNSNTQKNVLNSMVTDELINEAKKANKIFDAGIVSGNNPQAQIVASLKMVFGKAYSLTSALGYTDPEEQLVAAQRITDAVMKNASPATLQPEVYAKFTNGYMFDNPEEFREITGMDGTEPVFENAKNEFAKESILIEEIESQNVEIAPPVNEQPNNDALIINN